MAKVKIRNGSNFDTATVVYTDTDNGWEFVIEKDGTMAKRHPKLGNVRTFPNREEFDKGIRFHISYFGL